MKNWLFTFTAIFAVSTMAAPPKENDGKILAAFYEEWSIYYAGYDLENMYANGVAAKLTHLIYAFANVTSSPTVGCQLADPWADYQTPYLNSVDGIPDVAPLYGNFAEIRKLRTLYPNMKMLISLGGASGANTTAFSAAASTAAGRQALASSCINMFVEGKLAPGVTAPGLFDGIHIDWEFPTATDKENFTLLLAEFRAQLNACAQQQAKSMS